METPNIPPFIPPCKMETPNIPPFIPPCKVVCISNTGGWWDEYNIECPGPGFNEIVTVVGVEFVERLNLWFLQLKEYPSQDEGYVSYAFAPIQEQKLKLVTLTKILEKERENLIITAN